MRSVSLAFTFLFITSASVNANIKSVHCPLNCPSLSIPNSTVAFNHTYAVSINHETKFADWVAYEVDVINFGVGPGRNWNNNKLIQENHTLEIQDYKKANNSLKIDKGHLAPLAAFSGSDYWYELNFLSNITPQKSKLNQGAWKKLEEAVRGAVSYKSSLFVITGTLYGDLHINPLLPNADEEHVIPDAYYKVVYDEDGNSASFLMEQDTQKNINYCSKSVDFSIIEKHLNYSLPLLDDSKKIYSRLGCNK